MTISDQIIRRVLEDDEESFKDYVFPKKDPPRNFTDADVDTYGAYATLMTDKSELIHEPLSWQKHGLQQTSSGYGGKLTSEYCILFNGLKRRLYVTCYGNSSTTWFMVKGRKIVIH